MLIQITGEPGSGKSRSLKSLDPKETFIIDADGKGLAYAGWRALYNKENKNYMKTADLDIIKSLIKKIDSEQTHIKVIVIDTINTIASDMQMFDMKRASQDRWREFALDIYDLYAMCSELKREDLIIIFIAHPKALMEGDKIMKYVTKLPGKMLTNLNMNGRLNYNLYTNITWEDNKPSYHFITQSDGITEARSTEGVLPLKMDNDLGEVIKLIREKDLMITK